MLPFAEPEHVSLFFGCCVLRFVARHYVRRTRRNTTSKVSGLCHVFRWFWSDVRCLSICRTRSRPSLRMYGETRDRRCVRAAKYELCTDARRPACGGTRTALISPNNLLETRSIRSLSLAPLRFCLHNEVQTSIVYTRRA